MAPKEVRRQKIIKNGRDLVCRRTVARPFGQVTVKKTFLHLQFKETDAGGFWGIIAKFLLNLRFDWADEKALRSLTGQCEGCILLFKRRFFFFFFWVCWGGVKFVIL